MFSMRILNPMRAVLLGVLLLAPALAGDPRYIVRAPGNSIQHLINKGASVVKTMTGPAQGLYVMTLPGKREGAAVTALLSEPGVTAEPDTTVVLPEASLNSAMTTTPANYATVHATLQIIAANKAAGLCVSLTNPFSNVVAFYGYLCQQPVTIINLKQARSFATGKGIVGILDTGIDPFHMALFGSVIPGWDFTTNSSGGFASLADMQSTTSILDDAQSTTSILDDDSTVVVDQSTTSILDDYQSTTSILDQSTNSILKTRPADFTGHGTMVAGVVHLVAPSALLMPIKVFGSNGTAPLSQILLGIYYAADHGVKVLNMSFSMTAFSQELANAVSYANSKGVILVAAAGNDGKNEVLYPAGMNQVIGVGATTNLDIRSSYSNYGQDVDLAAPGDSIITTFPGNRWAMAWGTSLSTPFVSGGLALLNQMDSNLTWTKANNAITQCAPIGQQLGAGRLDLFRACSYEASHGGGH
jgi:subtilisin family serine protease